MAIEGTVKVPGGGAVPKKAAVAGLVIVTGLIGVFYYRKRKSAAAAPAAASTDQYPPDGTTGDPANPYSTDPATGQTYGNEAAGSGTFGAFGSLAGGGGGSFNPNTGLYYDPATGQYDLSSPYTGSTTSSTLVPGGPPFATNAAWSDWVIQELQAQNPAVNAGALTDALGLYLAGQGVDASEKTLIFDARAVAGDPPVAGPNRYPPNVRPAPGKGPGTKATVVVPNVTGDRLSNAQSALASAGLKAVFPPRKPGVGAYTVTGQRPAAGRRAAEGSTVHLTTRAA